MSEANVVRDELLDVVDAHDNVVGRMKRSEVYRRGLVFRAVNVFLENRKGQLWIPRRTAHKRLFPLCLDMSMGGHVESGESYEEALERELREELNLNLSAVRCDLLGYLTPNDGVSAFMKVYRLVADEEPDYNRNDFIEAYWFTPEAVLAKLRQGEPAKGDLAPLIERFYADKAATSRRPDEPNSL